MKAPPAAGTERRRMHWRKHDGLVVDVLQPVVDALRDNDPRADVALVRRAYEVAEVAHRGQVRNSGEPFISHPLSVAVVVAGIGLDSASVAAALLHDSVEDTGLSLEEIESGFGPEIARLVDGLTKLERIHFDSKEAQQAATMRKMLIAMAQDWRVLVIKLADRLHNMRTIAGMPQWKQRRTAQETLEIYAPLAHRLGVGEIRWQLEDLAFATLHPKRYAEIEQMVATRAPERDLYLTQVLDSLRERLADFGIKADIKGRPKHLWSIYEKMVVKNKEFNEIYDLLGVRILVESDKDCWAALGCVHSLWRPAQGRFKDYINSPKFNLYQSLHTTVAGPQGKALEVQIRTREMHQRAEYGIAAHWGYKEGSSAGVAGESAWLNRIVDLQADAMGPVEFLEALKGDLQLDEVYVFTPKGKVVTLPSGATPVDFAYSIHTEVGHRCIGARVNGRLAPLDSKLHSGDSVEIITSKVATAGPSRDWLKIVATPRARNKIRQWFSRERREDAIETGRDELVRALRREGLPTQKLSGGPVLQEAAEHFHFGDLDSFFAAIGEGHVSARGIAQRLARDLREQAEEQLPATVTTRRPSQGRGSPGVYVEGLDDMMVRLSRCCMPVPGDQIVGFVTRGRGVSVHRADCSNALSLSSATRERLIDVEWHHETTGVFTASVEVKALDRSRLLADVSRVLSEHHLNILSSSSHTASDRISRMRFEVELADPGHLESVIGSLRSLDSVYDAYRLLPGRS
ncbi:MAG: bifunctional (p)ppGpp synthetase/guanosine-3',5'-bis(diphosphate) 3'-pyrophosphohydrolase [Actinomycetota bacterium]|nr:bifunctional (p)ppGpp synthetase/guanosine-3',5'-bis(diphosphate) 3'-pyrophosphohydrolase [Actinomycetota bacterium]